MTTQDSQKRIIGPLKFGGEWNKLVEVADAFAAKAMETLLPRIQEIGARVLVAKTRPEQIAIAGDSNRAIAAEVMVAFMCGFRLAMVASVCRESDDGVVDFQVMHPEDPCLPMPV